MVRRKIYKILKIGLLCLTAILLFTFLGEILTPERTKLPWNTTSKIKGFYQLEKNSLDVIFLGSSHSFCSFNPAVFYRENKIRSYSFGSNEQPLWLTYHYLKETLKSQKPKVVVVEAFYISEKKEFKKTGVNKLSLDHLPLSLNKIRAQAASYENNIEGINPFYNYHDRWKNLDLTDFQSNDYGLLKGFTPLFKSNAHEIKTYDVKPVPIPEKNLEYLLKMIELADKEGVEIVFTYAPYPVYKEYAGHIKSLQQLTDSLDITFINYTDKDLLNEIGFDLDNDFDGGHTNVDGAQKLSKHLSNNIAARYDFNFSRDENYDRLIKRYEALDTLKTITDFPTYLNYVKELDSYIVITAMDAIKRSVKTPFKELGSSVDFTNRFRASYVGVFNPTRNYKIEQVDSAELIMKMNPDNVRKFYLRAESAPYDKGNRAKIYINNKDVLAEFKGRGFNIAVYDHVINQLQDVATFDTFPEGGWVRLDSIR